MPTGISCASTCNVSLQVRRFEDRSHDHADRRRTCNVLLAAWRRHTTRIALQSVKSRGLMVLSAKSGRHSATPGTERPPAGPPSRPPGRTLPKRGAFTWGGHRSTPAVSRHDSQRRRGSRHARTTCGTNVQHERRGISQHMEGRRTGSPNQMTTTEDVVRRITVVKATHNDTRSLRGSTGRPVAELRSFRSEVGAGRAAFTFFRGGRKCRQSMSPS